MNTHKKVCTRRNNNKYLTHPLPKLNPIPLQFPDPCPQLLQNLCPRRGFRSCGIAGADKRIRTGGGGRSFHHQRITRGSCRICH